MDEWNSLSNLEEDPSADTQDTADTPPKRALRRTRRISPRWVMFLCFALPFFLASIVFLISLCFTAGTNMILSSDGWHQYYPFLVSLREKFLNGGSMEYSWTVGMGQSYASLYAYYLASPMYLLSVLIPLDALPHYFTLMTIVKLSLSGFFFGWFLRLVYRRSDMTIPFFALMYAFCSWAAGYYWNIMWLDVFALLPLLIAGTVCLLRDGKFRLYIVALALSLWCNYYIAFFCCIFVLLCFVGYCISCWNGWKNFLRRLLRIGVCTLLGAGLACILLIPTLLAMQTTYSSTSKDFFYLWLNIADKSYGSYLTHGNIWNLLTEETIPGIYSATRQVLSGLLTGTTATNMEGLPNVFSGMASVILSVYYFLCKKISRREKLFNLCLLAFLILSFIVRILDYIWHGFHFPNMLPYRFSFLFSFVIIAMAYRAFSLMEHFKKRYLFVILPVAALLIVNAYFTSEVTKTQLVLSCAVVCGMTLFFLLYSQNRRIKNLAIVLLCLIATCEMTISMSKGVDAVGLTNQYNSEGSVIYPRKNENVQALLNYMEALEGNPLFYRTEVTSTQTLNDAALNSYHGVSIFNSSANANFNRFSRSLGLASWVGSNRYVYYESSPFTNTMCGIKYLIDRTDSHYNTDYNVLIAESGDVKLLKNQAFISIGFMTDGALSEFVAVNEKYNPIWEQEEMFRLATGIEDALYEHFTAQDFEVPDGCTIHASGTSGTQYSYTTAASSEEYQTVSIVYTLQDDGLYFATTKRPTDASSKLNVYCNDKKLYTIETKVRMLFCVGNFRAGDEIRFEYSLPSGNSATVSLDFAKQNNEVFDAGFAKLADEPFEITEFSDSHICGTIKVLSDGLFYTSIPYEPGWTAYVDGVEVELAAGYDAQNTDVLLTDAVISFPLSAGTHDIELVYSAPGLSMGAVISILSLLSFVALCILLRKNPVLLPDQDWQRQPTKLASAPQLFGISSVICLAVCADTLWLLIDGALHGYAPILGKHLLGKLFSPDNCKDDAVFLILLVVTLLLLPLSIWLVYRFFRCFRKERPDEPSEPSEAEIAACEEAALKDEDASDKPNE